MQRKMAAATCGRSETKLTIIWIQDWSWLGPCDGIAGGPAFIRVGPSIDREGWLKRGVACLYILHSPLNSTTDIPPLIVPAITAQQKKQGSKCSNGLNSYLQRLCNESVKPIRGFEYPHIRQLFLRNNWTDFDYIWCWLFIYIKSCLA